MTFWAEQVEHMQPLIDWFWDWRQLRHLRTTTDHNPRKRTADELEYEEKKIEYEEKKLEVREKKFKLAKSEMELWFSTASRLEELGLKNKEIKAAISKRLLALVSISASI